MGTCEIVAIVVGALIVALTVLSTIRRVKEMLWRKRVAKYFADNLDELFKKEDVDDDR